jgi:F-type H+-transporting ATPase subunit delta
LAEQALGITDAEVTSAHELHGDDRAELEASVSRLAGSRVRVQYKQDAALLGGAVVKIGSTVYDGSLRAQLEQMKQTLISA